MPPCRGRPCTAVKFDKDERFGYVAQCQQQVNTCPERAKCGKCITGCKYFCTWAFSVLFPIVH